MSVEKQPIGLSPKTWSLNPIPDGDGGDSNVDHDNDGKEDGDDDFFFFHSMVRQVCFLRGVSDKPGGKGIDMPLHRQPEVCF